MYNHVSTCIYRHRLSRNHTLGQMSGKMPHHRLMNHGIHLGTWSLPPPSKLMSSVLGWLAPCPDIGMNTKNITQKHTTHWLDPRVSKQLQFMSLLMWTSWWRRTQSQSFVADSYSIAMLKHYSPLWSTILHHMCVMLITCGWIFAVIQHHSTASIHHVLQRLY